MANFVDLTNRLVAEFGKDQRTEITERLKRARIAKHLPPARSRGGRTAADLTSLDCAVAILALTGSQNAYEATNQLTALRELTETSFTFRPGKEPEIDLANIWAPGGRLDEELAADIDKRRGRVFSVDFDALTWTERRMQKTVEDLKNIRKRLHGVPSNTEIMVGVDPLGVIISRVFAEDEGKLLFTTRRTFGENISPMGLWLGSVRIVTGEIIDIMADILGPYEDAT